MARTKRYTREIKILIDDATYQMLSKLSSDLSISQAAVVRMAIKTLYKMHRQKAVGRGEAR